QKELEVRNAIFVGSDSAASALCFDKWKYREVVLAAGLPMPGGTLVQIDNYSSNNLAKAAYVLKPINGGSSIDTYIVRDPTTAPKELFENAFTRYPTFVIEK